MMVLLLRNMNYPSSSDSDYIPEEHSIAMVAERPVDPTKGWFPMLLLCICNPFPRYHVFQGPVADISNLGLQ